MYEYEFRIAISTPLTSNEFLKYFPNAFHFFVIYAKPQFRWRQNQWETKKKLRSVTTYYDTLWFKLIESKELKFKEWNKTTHRQFIHSVALSQNPFKFENRTQIDLGKNAKLYNFRKDDISGIAFELEIGTFSKRWKTMYHDLTDRLAPFKELFYLFRDKPSIPYTLKPCTRKPVRAVESIENSKNILIAKKYDGVFGFVYSYPDRICEYWEGNERRVKKNISLGDGIVFGAERMSNGTVILLDVYQVQGLPTIDRKRILTEFLPRVSLPTGYQVQFYYSDLQDIPPDIDGIPTDGLIFHDVSKDRIYKQKVIHTIDLVYVDGYFQLPDGKRIKYPNVASLEDGAVYEIDIRGNDLKIIKKRNDRFTGNTKKQLTEVYNAIQDKGQCVKFIHPSFKTNTK